MVWTFKNIDIKIGMDAEEKCIKFLCFPYEIDTILSNLITNSITSFAKDDRLDKEITINLSKEIMNYAYIIRIMEWGYQMHIEIILI